MAASHGLRLASLLALLACVGTVAQPVHARSSHATRATSASKSTTKPAKLYACPSCNTHDHYVAPTVRRNGQVVKGHMQTNSNKTRADNFTHKGNVNPYTGTPGTKEP